MKTPKGFLLAVLCCFLCARAEAELAPGQPFPDLSFEGLVSPEDYGLLGLPGRQGPFRLSEVSGDLLILEFFNRHCLTCWRQAPQLESLVRLAAPGDLAGKVRVLSVGSGNARAELSEFRREHKVTYPMAPDALFTLYHELEDVEGMPFTAFLRRQKGQWILTDSHVGFYGDVEMLARARVLLRGGAAAPARADVERDAVAERAGEAARLKRFLGSVAGKDVDVEAVELPGGVRVYLAKGGAGSGGRLYGRLASRLPLCDLCHTIRFLLAVDDDGRVRGFEPLFVTKFGNEAWSDADTSAFWQRLAGRSADETSFDSKVDAVTSATMSSALIYDEVRRVGAALRQSQKGDQ